MSDALPTRTAAAATAATTVAAARNGIRFRASVYLYVRDPRLDHELHDFEETIDLLGDQADSRRGGVSAPSSSPSSSTR